MIKPRKTNTQITQSKGLMGWVGGGKKTKTCTKGVGVNLLSVNLDFSDLKDTAAATVSIEPCVSAANTDKHYPGTE